MSAIAGRVLILPKGDYDASVSYEFLDLVNHNSSSWLAKKASQGIEPSDANSEFWQKFGSSVTPDGVTIVIDENGVISAVGGTAEKVTYENESVEDVTNVKEALDGIFDGTQQVGDSAKLGGKDASEYEVKTSKNILNIYALRQGDYNGANIYPDIRVSQDVKDRPYIKTGDVFTISCEDETLLWYMRITDKNGISISEITAHQNAPQTFTAQADGYLSTAFGRASSESSGGWENITVEEVQNSKPQIEYGTEATEYKEFFKNNIQLTKELLNNIAKSDKPTGTYMGNGSSTQRTIATGGIGNTCILSSVNGMAIVTEGGASAISSSGSHSSIPKSQLSFKDGTLTMASTNTIFNASGVEVKYQIP